jgi:hypothetical protein
MDVAFGLLIAGAALVTGFMGTIWPRLMYDLDSEDRESGPPTPAKLRSLRITFLFLFLIACAGLYAILTARGPAEGPLF